MSYRRKLQLTLAVLCMMVVSQAPAWAGPFDPPPPQTAAKPREMLPMMPPVPRGPSDQDILKKMLLIGKINNTEVYYHEKTHCYLHVKNGVIEHDACYTAVSNWLLDAAPSLRDRVAEQASKIVH